MKLTITTLVIVEGSYIQGIFHSLEEHPGKAYQELVDQVENEYGYDADKDHVPLHFKTIQDIENYFELVHIGIGLILVLFLNSSGPNLDTFIPGNPWEHYCKYELHKHPFHTNEKEYNYFLDTFTSTDKYEQIMEIYANPR